MVMYTTVLHTESTTWILRFRTRSDFAPNKCFINKTDYETDARDEIFYSNPRDTNNHRAGNSIFSQSWKTWAQLECWMAICYTNFKSIGGRPRLQIDCSSGNTAQYEFLMRNRPRKPFEGYPGLWAVNQHLACHYRSISGTSSWSWQEWPLWPGNSTIHAQWDMAQRRQSFCSSRDLHDLFQPDMPASQIYRIVMLPKIWNWWYIIKYKTGRRCTIWLAMGKSDDGLPWTRITL